MQQAEPDLRVATLERLDDVDAAAAAVELDVAVDQGKERVVAALADALAGVELGAHLADQDIAGADVLPPKRFTPRRWPWESRPLRLEP